jgi:hypothetical protein
MVYRVIVFAFLGYCGAVTDACMDRPPTLAHDFRQIVALAGSLRGWQQLDQ